MFLLVAARAGGRVVDLGGPSVYRGGGGGTKFEIKHKSRCLQKSKLVDWGGASMSIGRGRPPWRRPWCPLEIDQFIVTGTSLGEENSENNHLSQKHQSQGCREPTEAWSRIAKRAPSLFIIYLFIFIFVRKKDMQKTIRQIK